MLWRSRGADEPDPTVLLRHARQHADALSVALREGDELRYADVLDDQVGDEQFGRIDHQGALDRALDQHKPCPEAIRVPLPTRGEVVAVDVVAADDVHRVRVDQVKAVSPATPRIPIDRDGRSRNWYAVISRRRPS